MNLQTEILSEAKRLFDVAGMTPSNNDTLLILGLVTTGKRDLDDFLRDEDGVFRLRGFEIHVWPRLESLIYAVEKLGLEAETIGSCGYPRHGELNLKQRAITAGLGSWGRNSLVIHPHFGPWLRLAAVRVKGIVLPSTGPGENIYGESRQCTGCSDCLDVCPLGLLEPYFLKEPDSCRAKISRSTQKGKLTVCDMCSVACPAGKRE